MEIYKGIAILENRTKITTLRGQTAEIFLLVTMEIMSPCRLFRLSMYRIVETCIMKKLTLLELGQPTWIPTISYKALSTHNAKTQTIIIVLQEQLQLAS